MIELARALLRQFRAVVRKSVLAAESRGCCPMAACRAGRQGLTLSCQHGTIGVRHFTPGSFPTASAVLPYAKLAELEGPAGVVALEQIAPTKVRAAWQTAGEPRSLELDTSDPATLPPAPEVAHNAVTLEPSFLSVLDDAARTASRDGVRYALNCIQLRGRDGAVIATDGKHLLIQRGFHFPWKDEQYIPALPVFGSRELPSDESVTVGLAQEHIMLEVGPWLFRSKVEQVRFPHVDAVIPSVRGSVTRLHLVAREIEELLQKLPSLPAHDDPLKPVTLDLGSPVDVRSRSAKGEIAEVVLSNAKREGAALLTVMDRSYLLRALKLGFTEILVVNAQTPLLCRDAQRTYVWMPLAAADAVPATAVSQADSVRARRRAAPEPLEPEKSNTTMPANEPRNGEPRHDPPRQDEPLDPITEGEELRGQLQAALARTSRLIAALKQQKRQSRVVESALASLRRLQQP